MFQRFKVSLACAYLPLHPQTRLVDQTRTQIAVVAAAVVAVAAVAVVDLVVGWPRRTEYHCLETF